MGTQIQTQSACFGAYSTRARVRTGDGPTVLCLHGFSDNADAWQGLFSAMAGTSAHLVAVDLPGFGDGPALAPRPLSVLDQACDFATAALAHYARRGPVILVGHSLGGRSVLTAAARRPQDVAAVVALAPAPLRLRAWLRAIAGERLLLPIAARGLRYLPQSQVVAHFLSGYRRTYHAPRLIDAGVWARYARYCDGPRVARYLEILHRISGDLSAPIDLSALAEVPVEILWGRQDGLVPVAAAAEYRRRLPHARYLEIEHCGHAIPQEKPASVARVLRQTLATFAPLNAAA